MRYLHPKLAAELEGLLKNVCDNHELRSHPHGPAPTYTPLLLP